jgi:hypothetical protein
MIRLYLGCDCGCSDFKVYRDNGIIDISCSKCGKLYEDILTVTK